MRLGGGAPPQAPHDRRKISFGFNLIWGVQSPLQKYFHSHLSQITCISSAIPAYTKGRFAIVTDVGAGCGGREERIDERAFLADGEVVWS